MASRKRKQPARKPSTRKPDALPYAADERNIFYFCDHGTKCRCKPGEARCRRIDPMAVLDILEESAGQYDQDMKLLAAPLPQDKPDPQLKEARRRVDDLLRRAFKLERLGDEGGVTNMECIAICQKFMGFLNDCKKKVDALRTSLGLELPPSFPRTLSPTTNASASNSASPGSMPSTPSAPAPESASSSEAIQEKHSGEMLPTT